MDISNFCGNKFTHEIHANVDIVALVSTRGFSIRIEWNCPQSTNTFWIPITDHWRPEPPKSRRRRDFLVDWDFESVPDWNLRYSFVLSLVRLLYSISPSIQKYLSIPISFHTLYVSFWSLTKALAHATTHYTFQKHSFERNDFCMCDCVKKTSANECDVEIC